MRVINHFYVTQSSQLSLLHLKLLLILLEQRMVPQFFTETKTNNILFEKRVLASLESSHKVFCNKNVSLIY